MSCSEIRLIPWIMCIFPQVPLTWALYSSGSMCFIMFSDHERYECRNHNALIHNALASIFLFPCRASSCTQLITYSWVELSSFFLLLDVDSCFWYSSFADFHVILRILFLFTDWCFDWVSSVRIASSASVFSLCIVPRSTWGCALHWGGSWGLNLASSGCASSFRASFSPLRHNPRPWFRSAHNYRRRIITDLIYSCHFPPFVRCWLSAEKFTEIMLVNSSCACLVLKLECKHWRFCS